MRVTRAKRALVGTAAGAMVLGLLPAGAAFADTVEFDDVCEGADATFPDIGSTHADAISCMADYDVIQGFDNGNFGTQLNIPRQQFASLVARFALTANPELDVPDEEDPFTDVTSSTHAGNVNALWNLGLIDGTTATTFSPNATLTRGQAATILVNAHVALGVDFGDENDSPFTDLGSTHGDAVEALYAAGIIEGRSATVFGYSAPITRGQIATLLARSAQVLANQVPSLWNATLLPVADLIALDVLTDDGDDFLYVSDGEAVTAYELIAGSTYSIDGTASSKAAFVQEVEAGDGIVINGNAYALTTVDLTLSGNIEIDLTDDVLDFRDAASGVLIERFDGEEFDNVVTGQFYTVDGAAANFNTFVNNISNGDFLNAVVLTAGEADDYSDFTFRHELTNAAASGTIFSVDTTESTVLVDPNADDDADADVLEALEGGTLIPVDENEDFVYIVDGDVEDFETLAGALDDGAELVYSLAAGVATYNLTTVPAAEFEAVSGVFINEVESAYVIGLGDEDDVVVTIADNPTYVVDGVVSLSGEFADDLTFGDTLACATGSLSEAEGVYADCSRVELTNVEQISARVVGAGDGMVTVALANGYEVTTSATPYGLTLAEEDAVLLNGMASFGEGEDAVDSIAIFVAALANTNLDVIVVTATLTHDGGDDAVWNFTNVPQSAIDEAIAAL